jgi:hypothetical protein
LVLKTLSYHLQSLFHTTPHPALYNCRYWSILIDIRVCEQFLVVSMVKKTLFYIQYKMNFELAGTCISVVIFLTVVRWLLWVEQYGLTESV